MLNNGQRTLSAGQAAPKFKSRDALGLPVSLNKFDNRYILLVFMRYSGCPWCNLAIHRLSLEYQTLQDHGCEVVTFIQSEAKDIVKNIYERHAHKPQFSIVADPSRSIYNLYGVKTSVAAGAKSLLQVPMWLHSVRRHGFGQTSVDGNLFVVPASFLIDGRTKKIIQTSYGSSYYDTDAFMNIYESVFFKEL